MNYLLGLLVEMPNLNISLTIIITKEKTKQADPMINNLDQKPNVNSIRVYINKKLVLTQRENFSKLC